MCVIVCCAFVCVRSVYVCNCLLCVVCVRSVYVCNCCAFVCVRRVVVALQHQSKMDSNPSVLMSLKPFRAA